MLNASIRRKALLVLLATVLVTPWPAAAGPILESPRSGRVLADLDLLDRLWSFLQGSWTKAGCMIDPNGKEGCHIDPNGAQTPIDQPKAGCHIDPNGILRCTP